MAHAVVTGASSGIGEAIVTRLLEQGWQVTGLSRSKVVRDTPAFESRSVDLSDSAALSKTLATLQVPDAVVHAAGMMAAAPLGEITPQISQQLWQLHVLAAETLVNHFAPRMKSGGRIVLIGSRTSRGITANVVAPGATQTPMLNAPGRASSPPNMPPIGRLIEPREVAALVGFVLSADAAAITGQELVMCGGASLK